jgi:hypothetical protein
VRLEGRLGRVDIIVMVRPARDWSAKLNVMRSAVAEPLAAAWVMASRRLPGPLSALEVTTKLVAREREMQVNKRNRVNSGFMMNGNKIVKF